MTSRRTASLRRDLSVLILFGLVAAGLLASPGLIPAGADVAASYLTGLITGSRR